MKDASTSEAENRPECSSYADKLRIDPDRPSAVPVPPPAQPRHADHHQQRRWAGQGGEHLRRSTLLSTWSRTKAATSSSSCRTSPRAEADRPHIHQHLGGRARRRLG